MRGTVEVGLTVCTIVMSTISISALFVYLNALVFGAGVTERSICQKRFLKNLIVIVCYFSVVALWKVQGNIMLFVLLGCHLISWKIYCVDFSKNITTLRSLVAEVSAERPRWRHKRRLTALENKLAFFLFLKKGVYILSVLLMFAISIPRFYNILD